MSPPIFITLQAIVGSHAPEMIGSNKLAIQSGIVGADLWETRDEMMHTQDYPTMIVAGYCWFPDLCWSDGSVLIFASQYLGKLFT